MKTFNVGLLKRPMIWGSVLAVVIAAAAWWIGWMKPEATKLASARQEQVTQRVTATSLATELATLRADAKLVKVASPFLARFGAAIPAEPDAPGIVVQAYHLAVNDGVTLQSITDDTLTPTSSGYSTIPVTMSVSGGHDAVLKFVSGLYGIARLLTIQSLDLTGTTSLLASGSATYTAAIGATAYTTYIPAASGSTGSGSVAAVPPTTG